MRILNLGRGKLNAGAVSTQNFFKLKYCSKKARMQICAYKSKKKFPEFITMALEQRNKGE
jgi:hypothetical protein